MKEIVSLHVGQAGNQIGFAIWELLCAEHGICRDGTYSGDVDTLDNSFETFFLQSHTGRFVPRGLFIDMEPTVIDQLRKGAFAKLYHPMQLISGNDDSAGNFSRAYHTVGRLLYGRIQNQLRRQIESCDCIQTLMFHRSLGGGAGSGLTSMLFELLDEYSKTVRLEFPIHPAPHFDSSVVAPYNSILAEHFCLDECDVGLLLDNEALFDICTNILEVKNPTMTTINRILGQVCSSLTAATRFHNDLCNDVTVVLTNLVPYPRIHFPLVSFAPLGNIKTLTHDELTVTSMTHAVFDNCNQLVKCDPSGGKYMSCSLVYRGLVSPCEVYSTLGDLKKSRRYRFVDWCPTGFKVGIVDQPPMIIPDSVIGETKANVVMMTNTSSVSAVWQRLAQKFHRLYAKRSFIHWFVSEGLEESEFCEALYNLATLAKDYEEVAIDSKLQLDALSGDKGEAVGEDGEDGAKSVASTIKQGSQGKNSKAASSKLASSQSGQTGSTGGASSKEDSNYSNVNYNCQRTGLHNNSKRGNIHYYDRGNTNASLTIQNDDFQWRKGVRVSTNRDHLTAPLSDDMSSTELKLISQMSTPDHINVYDPKCNSTQSLPNAIIPSNTNSNNRALKAKPPKSHRKYSFIDSEDEEDNILNSLISLTSH